jgi:hypothetical protein
MFLCFKGKLKKEKTKNKNKENYFENLKEKEKLTVVQPPQA